MHTPQISVIVPVYNVQNYLRQCLDSIIKQFNLSFPEQRLIHEDEYWAWAYGIHCQSYFYLPDKLYNYRIHSHSITATEKNSPRPLDIIDINVLITRELQRFNLLPQLENVFNQNLTAALLKSGAEYYGEARCRMAGYLEIPGISEQFGENISALVKAEIPFSVIVPVYNTAPWLTCCLDNLLNQTTDIFEIICINDGSTDNSLQILEQYAADNSRIRIINQPNRGVSAARNAGLAAARGKYIIFIDSDDWIEPHTIKKTFLYMQQHQLDILAFRLRLYNPATQAFHSNTYYDFSPALPVFSLRSGKKNRNNLLPCHRKPVQKSTDANFSRQINLLFAKTWFRAKTNFLTCNVCLMSTVTAF